MYKDELILIHQHLVYLKRFLTSNGASNSYFVDYEKLGISPHHIHKTKAEHKYAVFLLAKGVSGLLNASSVVPERFYRKMDEMAKRSKDECYWLKD
jgi:hypothetical protein